MVHINATDPRYFPFSELPNLHYLNLSRSTEMANSFLNDYPLLTTVKQLEVLDLDSTNLTRAPLHLQRFLPRLRVLSLRGNPLNCSDTSFSEWKEPYRLETPRHVTNSSADLKVRVTKYFTGASCDRVSILSRCTFNVNCTITLKDDFWSTVLLATSTTTNAPFSLVKRKLSLRSLSGKTILNTTTWDNLTTILLPTTQQTIMKVTFVTAKLPTEATSEKFSADLSDNLTSEGLSSFFDWFPSLNNSAADRARMAHHAAGDESGQETTHPGLVIFLFVSGFILVAFGSLIAPPCVQTRVYRWRWRHQRSQPNQQNQPNIEISSISAFVDSEIRLD